MKLSQPSAPPSIATTPGKRITSTLPLKTINSSEVLLDNSVSLCMEKVKG